MDRRQGRNYSAAFRTKGVVEGVPIFKKGPSHLSLAVALAVMLGGCFAAPARAQYPDLPVTECANSPASLPVATEGVPYNATILTSTSPALRGMKANNLPPGLSLVDHYIRGTPTAPGPFNISLDKSYANGCGKGVKEKSTEADAGPGARLSHEVITLQVRDTHQPAIGSFTVTPNALGAAGGSITLMVKAADNVGVTRVMMTTRHPDGHSGSAYVPITGGTPANGVWSITFPLSGNTTTAPVSYVFTISVGDLDGNTAKPEPKTVTIAAPAAQQPPPRLLQKP